MARCALLVALLAAGAVGCAATAEKPPTPAAEIPAGALDYPAPPGERYYIVVFGSQRVALLRPALTHTWAVVIKATRTDGCTEPHLDVQQISWLPDTLEVRPMSFRVEPPVNLGLHETLRWAKETGQKVAMWGPFEVQPRAYRRFLIQREFLETSGQVGYQCIDTVGEAGREGNGCDCIHAITDLDPQFDRSRYPLIFYGHTASRRLVREVARRQAIIDPWTTHDWLIPALGLDQYPIDRRDQPYRGIRRPIDPNTGGAAGVRALWR
ncbi:MAG TPA: hypothetical protein VFG68_20615 [Fimbriiglobus sp.]|nr:hypothetical protein [Fimbriiglobus sp.]